MSKENHFDGRGTSHLKSLFERKIFVTLHLESRTHIVSIITAAIALGPFLKLTMSLKSGKQNIPI